MKRKDSQQASLGPIGYKISLLTVAPGKEGNVANRIRRAIETETGNPPICVLKIFGRYDVCVIYQSKDFLEGPSRRGSIDNIRGGNQILAFPLDAGQGEGPFNTRRGDVWGLLFFRINESLARTFGAHIDTVLTQYWRENALKDVTLNILGTTGWAELVFIVRGKRFSDITTALSNIGRKSVVVITKEMRKHDLFSAKTFSLVGIDFQLTQPPLKSSLPKRFNEQFTYGEGVFPTFDVTCAPGDMKAVIEFGEKKFGRGFGTFGCKDVVFKPQGTSTWGEFIKAVLDTRNGLAQRLYSTSVNVLCEQTPESMEDLMGPGKNRRGLSITKSRMGLFERWGPIFENSLRNLYFGLSNLMQDPLIGDCFEDLRIAAEDRLLYLLKQTDREDEDVRMHVGTYIQAITHGAEERARGAFLGLEHSESQFSPTKGGIQRVLKAAGVIVERLLENVGLKWKGFVVAGFQGQGFSSITDIVNLPFDLLFCPERWWGLFHEVGHAALFEGELVDLDGEEVSDILLQLVPDIADEERVIMWKKLMWELGADTFDLYFCYGDDIDFYLENIWSYIVRPGRDLDDLHFIRYFCVFEYWKYLVKRRRKTFPNAMPVKADIDEFIGKLTTLDLRTPNSMGLKDEASAAFQGVARVLEMLHRSYSERVPMKKLGHELRKKGMKEAIENVLQGKIFLNPIRNPETFILGLKKEERHMTFQARMAAIMTLWHTAVLTKNENAKKSK